MLRQPCQQEQETSYRESLPALSHPRPVDARKQQAGKQRIDTTHVVKATGEREARQEDTHGAKSPEPRSFPLRQAVDKETAAKRSDDGHEAQG